MYMHPFSFGIISDANGFVKLIIDQRIGRGALSSSLKFHGYNYWGCGGIVVLRFPFSTYVGYNRLIE